LAAWYAHQAVSAKTDLVLWINAAQPGAVVGRYAQAASRVQAPGVDGSVDGNARAFLEWLMHTKRSWLIVLDDISDLEAMGEWWPSRQTGNGWVLATTRRRDAVLSDGGRGVIDVDVYTSAESLSYLSERLTTAGSAHLLDSGCEPLTAALEHLPLAFSLAAAYMIDQDVTCQDYLGLFSQRLRLEDVLPPADGSKSHNRQIAVTLLLAMDSVTSVDPLGLAMPMLQLAAMLDPAGHPDAFWATAPVIRYLTAHCNAPPDGRQVTAQQAHAALRLLRKYSLITHERKPGARGVRIHALTARAVRETVPAVDLPASARACAEGLLCLWPEPEHTSPELAGVLRSNVGALLTVAGDLLWQPMAHEVLYHAGNSFLISGLHKTAITFWRTIIDTSKRLLGPKHPDELRARARLAVSYQGAGRIKDGMITGEKVTADMAQRLGTDHPQTLRAQAILAGSYWQLERTNEAVTMAEHVAAMMTQVLGPEHRDTRRARNNLALVYEMTGRIDEAIVIAEQVVIDMIQTLGPEDPDTLRARGNLAVFYRDADRVEEATLLQERITADMAQTFGFYHPDTLQARENLALVYGLAQRTDEAIVLAEQVIEDMNRDLGSQHPETMLTRTALAGFYLDAGRTSEALTLAEQVTADLMRVYGPDHSVTLNAKKTLARAYQQAGRTAEALTLAEQVTANMTRILGTTHPDTLSMTNMLHTWQR